MLVGTIVVLILLDSIKLDRAKAAMPAIAGLGLLGALIPLATLAADGTDQSPARRWLRRRLDVTGAQGAVHRVRRTWSCLLSTNYMAEGDYWESEYYTLLLCSVLGMTVMASSRDLIGIFVALELLSIPAYMLAAWRKGDEHSNEAGLKYYLMGVFASAILLYGLSLAYGLGGSTRLTEVAVNLASLGTDGVPLVTLALAVHDHRVRLQGLRGAVPRVGSRHL